ncbi:MAG: blue light receptor [Peltula sp. TS41687]|nr:MAG: blue light receptor [Peltula sp. TS41687]
MEEPGAANMDAYFGRSLSDVDLVRMGGASIHADVMAVTGMESVAGGMVGGDTLDDIVLQNQKEMERRRSMHPAYARTVAAARQAGADLRRTSLMEFGAGRDQDMDEFPFQSPVLAGNGSLMANGAVSRSVPNPPGRDISRRHPAGDLTLNTHFAGAVDMGYSVLSHPSPFQSALQSANPLDLETSPSYDVTGLSAHVANSMNMGFPSSGMMENGQSSFLKHLNHSAVRQGIPPQMAFPSAHPSFASATQTPQDPGGGQLQENNRFVELGEDDRGEEITKRPPADRMEGVSRETEDTEMFLQDPPSTARMPPPDSNRDPPNGTRKEPIPGKGSGGEDTYFPPADGQEPKEIAPAQSEQASLFRGIYSSSGFDMLKILMRVATRSNPEINIGAVDMSCAFVVCDVSQHDLPIVYCSEVFERLTGYSRHEILGRNCRFLQAPDGKVQSGYKRKYVDDEVVFRLKNKVTGRREAQTSLINYRKGGQPFMNLLTMIPITWDSDEIRFFVGFQVDLVEMPQSVTNKNPDGTYSINYQRGYLPRYVWNTPENTGHQAERGQTIPRDDVSTVLSTIATGESELSKRIWDKVLLENTDDVVHVLSLKGLFLYLSPASRKVLEYDSSELVGSALSSVCHPSDIVPVTRELKDTSTGASVNVVFRIRRKHSGYTWFESHGSLHTEQGKGRKCIILVGRERPVYALSRNDIISNGGIGESELWTKLSTSGMFLFVSSNVKTLLDRLPEELVGTSMQALMRKESKQEFGRQLELARTGKRAQVKHEVQNRRGLVLQAHTTLYPGDAVEGQKPTFFVGQTRLLKASRATFGLNNPVKSTPTPSPATTATSNPGPNGTATPQIPEAPRLDTVTTQPGGSGLPIGTQGDALASEDNVFDELKTTRSTSWQFELRQMEKRNRLLNEELQTLLSAKKKRKRSRKIGQAQKDCANCHTQVTPEWRRGPSGNRDLCNSCGLRWAKQNGRVSPRGGSQQSDKASASPGHSSPPMDNGATLQPSSSTNMPPPSDFPRTSSSESHHSGASAARAAAAARNEPMASQGYGGYLPSQQSSSSSTVNAKTQLPSKIIEEESTGIT